MSLRISAGSEAKNLAPVDWNALKHEILSKLSVAEEYENLGVKFATTTISIKGWRDCHAIDRPDDVESAAVNVQTWLYHDRGGEGKTLNFYDFALKYGNWGTWIDVIRHYADKAGVEVGEVTRSSKGRIEEAAYHFTKADGELSYAEFRYRLPNGKKDFKQYPYKNGQWLKEKGCMDGVAPLPYRLPDLLEADDDEPVLCVEGEKDVERAYSIGLVATTSHQGCNSTIKTWGAFAGDLPRRDYYVIPDNDPGGRLHAQRVCAYLYPIARSVRYLSLPGLPLKGDLSDWLDLGGTVEELGQLMAKAPLWTPEVAEQIEQAEEAASKDELDEDATAGDLIAANTTIRWIWENWIPVGVLTALAAEPGCGKTRELADILSIVWNGKPTWPDGSPNTLPAGGKAIWVASDNQHPELGGFPEQFGFDPAALVLNASKRNPFGGTMLDTVEDLHDFEKRIKRVQPVFVFIDTTGNATDRNGNEAKEAKAFFKPLQEIAQRCQVAIICVTHLNADGKPLGRRIQGQCRVVISMSQPDPDGQPNRRKLWVTKSNSLHPPALGVTMGTNGNTYDFHPPEKPPEEKPGRGGGKNGKKPPPKVKECAEWLRELMKGKAMVPVGKTRDEAEEAGFSSATLYAARDLLSLEQEENMGRQWWKMPLSEEGEIEDAKGLF